jgi:hypothetical protein
MVEATIAGERDRAEIAARQLEPKLLIATDDKLCDCVVDATLGALVVRSPTRVR